MKRYSVAAHYTAGPIPISAHLVRDLHAGTYNTPGFEHALHNARLIEAVRHAAEQGERQSVV
ncbi:MAG TPA: hypothetical protein VGH37_10810 [Candidatus Acidoferrum sp.]